MHREIRIDRNRYKITAAGQARLAGAKIGIIGLSMGNMAAITFALEGIGRHFRLADFDRLSLSNLNWLRGGAPSAPWCSPPDAIVVRSFSSAAVRSRGSKRRWHRLSGLIWGSR